MVLQKISETTSRVLYTQQDLYTWNGQDPKSEQSTELDITEKKDEVGRPAEGIQQRDWKKMNIRKACPITIRAADKNKGRDWM